MLPNDACVHEHKRSSINSLIIFYVFSNLFYYRTFYRVLHNDGNMRYGSRNDKLQNSEKVKRFECDKGSASILLTKKKKVNYVLLHQ